MARYPVMFDVLINKPLPDEETPGEDDLPPVRGAEQARKTGFGGENGGLREPPVRRCGRWMAPQGPISTMLLSARSLLIIDRMGARMPTYTRNLSKFRPWVLPIVASLSACSGSNDSAVAVGIESSRTGVLAGSTSGQDAGLPPRLPIAAPPEELSPDPDPSFPGCLAITTAASGPRRAISIFRWSYDPVARLLTSVPSDERGTVIDSPDPNQSRALYWKLDVKGNVVLRAGGGSGYRPFRQTIERDEYGNVIALRAVYLDAIDLVGDVEGQSYSVSEFANEYDGSGRLGQHRAVRQEGASATSYTYAHDGAGRCEIITNVGGGDGIERRDYDAAGRLWHRHLEGMPLGGELGTVDSVVTYQYDDLGRLRSAKEVMTGDDTPISELLLGYRDDGSFVEEQSHLSDTGDGSYRRVWSPGCSEIQPLLLRGRPEACVANYGSAGDFHIP